jgi:rhodanese-related sulfurtransferase
MPKTAAEMLAEANAQIETISLKDAHEEVAAGKAMLLDIREPMEWEQHIPGAVQVPRGVLEWIADPTSPKHNAAMDPARRWIVYCRSGVRAALATTTLKTLGYESVANLAGGFNAWRDAGLPVEDHHHAI